MITAVILTFNEEKHLQRCINSVKELCDSILIVDSGSTDLTHSISEQNNCIFIYNKWINYSEQFNFALDYTRAHIKPEWILRLDADEYLPRITSHQISILISQSSQDFSSLVLPRRIIFKGKELKYGGVGKTYLLRVFKLKNSYCEHRWMDEHIVCQGKPMIIESPFYDHNLNNITWWIEKHNSYSSREAVDLLMHKYARENVDPCSNLVFQRASIVRWAKSNIYINLPASIRPILYFVFRYVFLLGFLDGILGFYFHFLQCLWYRHIVELKIKEVELCMATGESVESSIFKILGIKVSCKEV